MNQKYKGIILILMSALCFAGMNLFIRLSGDIPTMQKSFFRNIVAVATLADTACVLLAEGVTPDEGVAQLATDKGVNILQSDLSAYEIALRLRDAL